VPLTTALTTAFLKLLLMRCESLDVGVGVGVGVGVSVDVSVGVGAGVNVSLGVGVGVGVVCTIFFVYMSGCVYEKENPF